MFEENVLESGESAPVEAESLQSLPLLPRELTRSRRDGARQEEASAATLFLERAAPVSLHCRPIDAKGRRSTCGGRAAACYVFGRLFPPPEHFFSPQLSARAMCMLTTSGISSDR
jgi:hypothetical protein